MSFYSFASVVCRAFIKLAFQLKIEGEENIPKDGGFIVCSNHRSFADPIMLALPLKNNVIFMAKAELFRNRFFAWILRKLGAFPVERGKGDMSAVNYAIDSVKNGKVLVLFPEGTRSRTGELLRLRSGAVVVASQTQGTIVPVGIQFAGKLHFRSKVTVRYGEPLPAAALGLDTMDKRSLRGAKELLREKLLKLLEERT